MSQDALPAGWPAMSIAQTNALLSAPGMGTEVELSLIHI